MKRCVIPLVGGILIQALRSPASAGEISTKNLILATTTSTVDSGILDVLVSLFEKKSGYAVKTISVGSGLALEMGRRGEADILLVHSPEAEEKLIQEGSGINRQAVMHNYFVLLGPPNDPAGVKGASSAVEAFSRIARSGALFISRGDQSGTHIKERSLWQRDPAAFSARSYLESGQGMGPTLIIADQKEAYVLSDRGTYLGFKRKLRLIILYEGDQILFNPYHVIEINPAKHSRVNASGARAFTDFITSAEIQKLIGEFGRGTFGQSLFFPDAEHGRR